MSGNPQRRNLLGIFLCFWVILKEMSLDKLCPKILCEICGNKDIPTLQRHHIVERTDPECTNHHMNLAVVCANCHTLIHAGRLKIVGVFPGTRPPAGRIVVFIKDGICNVPELKDAEPYFKPKPKAIKLHKG